MLLWGAGRFSVKKTFMVSGSESVDTTFLLASEIEYILFRVKSILKKSVMPARLIRTMTTR